jgi:Amt family ammonium transporter
VLLFLLLSPRGQPAFRTAARKTTYGGSTQIIAQVLEAVAVAVFVFATTYAFFTALKRMGLLRSRAEDELAGLDLPEMGSPGYVAGDISVPGGEVHEPGPVKSGVAAPAS